MANLMRLVAYGAQDVYLRPRGPIVFFRIQYQQRLNFVLEPPPAPPLRELVLRETSFQGPHQIIRARLQRFLIRCKLGMGHS